MGGGEDDVEIKMVHGKVHTPHGQASEEEPDLTPVGEGGGRTSCETCCRYEIVNWKCVYC